MKINRKNINAFLATLFGHLFICVCIYTGIFLISYLAGIGSNAATLKIMHVDYTPLLNNYKIGIHLFFAFALGFWILICFIFFYTLRLFSLLDTDDPFHNLLSKLLIKISRLSFIAGLFALAIRIFFKIVENSQFSIDKTPYDPVSVLFFAGVIYLIATIFQKGESQKIENKLTVGL